MRHALSFDVEDYFHVTNYASVVSVDSWGSWPSRVERNIEIILDELEAASVRATFFVLGWCAERFPAMVRQIADAGHEIAAHSYDHRLVYNLTPDEFRADLRRTRKLLEDVVGEPIVGYRAPSFSITDRASWALDILVEEGYAYDSSVFPVRHRRYGNREKPRFPYRENRGGGTIAEFPLSTVRFLMQNLPVSGGGYFRLFPYSWLKRAMRSIEREGNPGILYLHPWEFDPEQPRVRGAGPLANFRHRLNLATTLPKLRAMMNDFSFAPVSDVLRDCGVLSTS